MVLLLLLMMMNDSGDNGIDDDQLYISYFKGCKIARGNAWTFID